MHWIFLHGLGQTPASWEKVLDKMGTREESLCPDLAAMCQEERTAYPDLYQGLCRVCSQTEGPVNLCGLSLGGVLALHYAIDHPEKVNSLVLIAAQYKMPRALLMIQNLLFHFMPESMFQSSGFGKKAFIRLCSAMRDLDFTGSLEKVSCKALVLCGGRDKANRKAAEALAELLKNGRLQIIENAGHEVNVDAPDALARAISGFCSEAQ